ncbi:hypothetical protein E05_43310 [Plautia stali symbiont]|nr:hypothetical protein E05_43310 [Plautia stali symbiont]
MKALLIALVGLSLSASALADDTDADAQENIFYASQSPSAMNKPSFNEETAQEVVNGWLELCEEERAKLRHDQQQCEQTVMTQFQQQD